MHAGAWRFAVEAPHQDFWKIGLNIQSFNPSVFMSLRFVCISCLFVFVLTKRGFQHHGVYSSATTPITGRNKNSLVSDWTRFLQSSQMSLVYSQNQTTFWSRTDKLVVGSRSHFENAANHRNSCRLFWALVVGVVT